MVHACVCVNLSRSVLLMYMSRLTTWDCVAYVRAHFLLGIGICSTSSGVGPCGVSPICTFMSADAIIILVLFWQPYCWKSVDISSLSSIENTNSRHPGLLALMVFLLLFLDLGIKAAVSMSPMLTASQAQRLTVDTWFTMWLCEAATVVGFNSVELSGL